MGIAINCQDSNINAKQCGKSHKNSFGIEDIPGLAFIYYEEKAACAGALISNDWILTTARCARNNKNLQKYKILLGSQALGIIDKGIMVNIKEIVTHPQYDKKTSINDIALIKLKSSVEFIGNNASVCVNENPNLELDNSGFSIEIGCISNRGVSHVSVMHEGAYDSQHYSNLDKKQFISTKPKKTKNECPKQYGGSLFLVKQQTKWYLAGIESRKEIPGDGLSYSRISNFIQWIYNVVENKMSIGKMGGTGMIVTEV